MPSCGWSLFFHHRSRELTIAHTHHWRSWRFPHQLQMLASFAAYHEAALAAAAAACSARSLSSGIVEDELLLSIRACRAAILALEAADSHRQWRKHTQQLSWEATEEVPGDSAHFESKARHLQEVPPVLPHHHTNNGRGAPLHPFSGFLNPKWPRIKKCSNWKKTLEVMTFRYEWLLRIRNDHLSSKQ
ncbi:unnamed protein product [Durusdinium trenchii]|uniref:Uncharacterized protein n=1 Tax=Durusdinium trenchii TaxID=1381693 RepID=A0ABP0QAR2_9DINO